MEFSAEQIAAFLEGEIVGDKNIKVNTVSKIEEAEAGSLAFLSNMKYEHYIYTTGASIVIVDKTFEAREEIKSTLVKVASAREAFSMLLDMYVAAKPRKKGISPKSSISESATIGEDCYIGDFAVVSEFAKIGDNTLIYPNTYIGDKVKIGKNCTIYSGVNIYEECVLGDNVVLHSGSVIGADGFGFVPDENGVYKKFPQIGNVVIEDDVEIGANTTIDRAAMGSTIIKKGVKLDNLIQVAHNVVIGENTVSAAQVGIAGSTKIGKNCMFGGQVGMAGHITIADYTQIGSQAGVSNSITEPKQTLLGSPATDARACARQFAATRRLPDLLKEVNTLRKELDALKAKQ